MESDLKEIYDTLELAILGSSREEKGMKALKKLYHLALVGVSHPERTYSIAEAAIRLKVSQRKVYYLLKEGFLHGYRLGEKGTIRIKEHQIEDFEGFEKDRFIENEY